MSLAVYTRRALSGFSCNKIIQVDFPDSILFCEPLTIVYRRVEILHQTSSLLRTSLNRRSLRMHTSVLLSVMVLALSPCIAGPTSSSTSLSERGAVADCNGGTYSGSYTDGQGTYAYSDTITHPYKFPAIRKCWRDYFVVSANTAYGPLSPRL